MAESKDALLRSIREGKDLGKGSQTRLTLLLCAPAILAQVASVLLQFIDASMVGSLGAGPSASIGLVSTTTWIFGGFVIATSQGFSVQVAHLIGSNDLPSARKVMQGGLLSVLVFAACLALVGLTIAGPLPGWLGGGAEINDAASEYFRIYTLFLPAMGTGFCCAGMLQCSGNMKVPSMLNILMCTLDVILNFIFIYPTREVSLLGATFTMPGAGMGVKGAALGTGLAECITALLGLYFIFFRSKELKLQGGEKPRFIPTRQTVSNALGITGPLWFQNLIMRGAYVMSTIIVAPLGAVAIAANSFAITAESFCYMPGYGMGDAATTLVGQSLGAGRKDLARSFTRICIYLGVGMMVSLAVLMFLFATPIMSLLSIDPDVIALGAKVLRIEAFAEAGYAAAIVASGACIGAGDTKMSSILNLGSMWLVRIGLALILTPRYGLVGYWIAMCIELNVRGLLFVWRTSGTSWLKGSILSSSQKA